MHVTRNYIYNRPLVRWKIIKTGNAAPSNLLHLQGARFAVEELNARSGVFGTPLELLEFDNASTEIGSQRAAEQAIASGVSAIIGASWGSHSLAMAPVLQAAPIPMISPLSTHPELTGVGEYIFRVCFTDEFQGSVMAKFAFHDLHARNATDFTPHIEQILALEPDVLFVPGYESDSAYIIMPACAPLAIIVPRIGIKIIRRPPIRRSSKATSTLFSRDQTAPEFSFMIHDPAYFREQIRQCIKHERRRLRAVRLDE